MADVRHRQDVPFDRLPDEIVVEIFSYFSFDELLDVLQNVCMRWKQLVHTPSLWVDKEYVIKGSSDELLDVLQKAHERWEYLVHASILWVVDKEYLIRGRLRRPEDRGCSAVGSSSKRGRCRFHETDAEVLEAVGTMPLLRNLTIKRGIRGRMLRKICENCPNLTNLQIEAHQIFNYCIMKYIFEMCPKIEKLTVPAGMLTTARYMQQLSALESLSRLVVVDVIGDNRKSAHVKLPVLADTCRSLKEMHTDSTAYDLADMEYFLKAKKGVLTAATVRWILGTTDRWCIVPLLKRCEIPLRKLRLLHCFMASEEETVSYEALGDLHSLQELYMNQIFPFQPHLLSLPFQPGCLTELRRLHLRCAFNLKDETLLTISRGCPNLVELRFFQSEDLTDESLTEIHRLKHLQILELSKCTGLGGTAMAHIASLPALHSLILQLLDLNSLQPSLQEIVNLTELRSLDLYSCFNLTAVPFAEFPERLVKLRNLRVSHQPEAKHVIAELKRQMPHLRICNTFQYSSLFTKSNEY